MGGQAGWAVTNLVQDGTLRGVSRRTFGVLTQKGRDFVRGPVSPPLIFRLRETRRQPCRRPVVTQVVQRAEMTRIAPEGVLPRVVQAGLKVRMVTGPQKAAVRLAEEERRWKLL